MAEHNELGKQGEDAAARYLVLHGYNIRERDWRIGHRDIDIVAEKRGLLVFVEVKTRRNNKFGEPEIGVTPEKIRYLLSAADTYIRMYGIDMAVRFDVLSVIGEAGFFKVHHILDAFNMGDWKTKSGLL